MVTDPLLTTSEVAERLRVPEKTIYAWRYAKRAPRAIVVGRHLRFRQSDIEAWLEAQADPLTA